jgi:hypothetical protein
VPEQNLDCQIASNCDPPFAWNGGSDSILMKFADDPWFSNGESAPCERTFGFRRLCRVGCCFKA